MTIQQCKYVLKIADVGSFNEAAKQLFVAQSSLSSSVKALEEELGIKIFERLANGVYLTREGSEFIRYAQKIVHNNNFIVERYSTEKNCPRLYISTQHYDFIADIFGKMLGETQEDIYRFSLRETQTYKVIREIETGYSDIGVLAIKDKDYGVMRRYLDKRGLRFTSFLKAPPHVFVRKEHPIAKNEDLTYEDLKEYPYVSYEQGKNNISFFEEEMMPSVVNKHIEISDRASLMNVLLSTDCYTIGTGLMPSALNNGSIVSIPIKSNEFYIIGYILHIDRTPSAQTLRFIEHLKKVQDLISQ